MRYLVFILTFSILFACQSPEEKKAAEDAKLETVKLNPSITEIVTFMADSVADCQTWLAKDYRPRKFFDASDTLADFLTEKFSHDDILAFYESVETNTLLDLTPYLIELRTNHVAAIDSVKNCAASINSIAFLNNKQKAMVLFSEIGSQEVFTINYLLQKTRGGWQITDTLRQEKHPRTR